MTRFESIINTAIKESMSDIHITGEHPVVLRKQGDIQFHTSLRWTHQEIDDFTRKLLIWILPGSIPTIEELNLHSSLHDISRIESGLVLICGATGVGKTTTIAAIINDINKSRQTHIITLEDPIEYRFQSKNSFIEQRELGSHMPSFKQGLIDVLREDPDVIVVDELREGETMQLALNAAESGHLVIAIMHAASPEEAVYRMCNAVPVEAQNEVRNQLASTLAWIVVLQLIHLEKAGQRVPVLTIVHGTQPIKNIIRDNKLHQLSNTIEISKNEGMFLAERYFTEYLKTRSDFTSCRKIFRPSTELSQDSFYQSPLTEDPPQIKHEAKHQATTASQPIIDVTGYSDENIDSILNINDDITLNNIAEKLNKNNV